MIGQALLRITFALGLLVLVTSCAELDTPATTGPVPAPTPEQGYWHGDGVSGSPTIIVSIADQRAYFYKGKQLVGESTVSTGKPGFGTPPGYYTVFWKDAEHVSSVFGDYVDDFGNVTKSNIDVRKDSKPPGSHYDGARMPFAMFFRGGFAMHQGYVPPYAASHGCIRLPKGMAEVFFNASPPGTPVIVKQEAVMHRVVTPPPAPMVDSVAPAGPNFVRNTTPPPIRPAVVRSSTVQAPTPIPLRSPPPVVSRAPGTFPMRSPSPTPLRSPAPSYYRTPVPMQSPTPPIRSSSPAPVRSSGPVLMNRPTPTPAPSRPPAHIRTRTPGRLPTPSPTATPRR
jgi:hypothetical protein